MEHTLNLFFVHALVNVHMVLIKGSHIHGKLLAKRVWALAWLFHRIHVLILILMLVSVIHAHILVDTLIQRRRCPTVTYVRVSVRMALTEVGHTLPSIHPKPVCSRVSLLC